MARVLRRVLIVVRSTRTGLKHRAHLLWVMPGRDAFMRSDAVRRLAGRESAHAPITGQP